MRKNLFIITAALMLPFIFCEQEARAQKEDVPKFEIGAQFSSLTLRPPDRFGSQTEPGFGARITYNLTDHVAVEAESNLYLRANRFFTSTTGGRAVQGQFGIKAGRRFERFGIFAKARPGLISFSNSSTIIGIDSLEFEGERFFFPITRDERKTHFTTDVGGVLEFYPSRRIVTRFDFGDTIIRYGSRQDIQGFSADPSTLMLIQRPAEIKHNFQFTAGVGFRF